jgi:hypothetical protein
MLHRGIPHIGGGCYNLPIDAQKNAAHGQALLRFLPALCKRRGELGLQSHNRLRLHTQRQNGQGQNSSQKLQHHAISTSCYVDQI